MQPSKLVINTNNFILGECYSRFDVADAGQVERPAQARDWSGIVSFINANIFFVTLDKDDHISTYNDYFDLGGTAFHWDSQSKNTQNTSFIKEMIEGKKTIHLFVRAKAKLKSKTQPFVYAGELDIISYQGEKPVEFIYDVLDFDSSIPNLQELYLNHPPLNRSERLRRIPQKNNFPRKKKSKPGQQGRMVDAKKKKAIEMHAMDKATKHYEEQGFVVKDTSANKPYDLSCEKDKTAFYVEVKGTTSKNVQRVNVTANEVASARLNPTDLYIVSEISVSSRDGEYKCSGGEENIVSPWSPIDEDLRPTSYIYTLQ